MITEFMQLRGARVWEVYGMDRSCRRRSGSGILGSIGLCSHLWHHNFLSLYSCIFIAHK